MLKILLEEINLYSTIIGLLLVTIHFIVHLLRYEFVIRKFKSIIIIII